MKTMRYRMRMITLVLICALAAVTLWGLRSFRLPDAEEETAPVSAAESPAAPDAAWPPETPVPSEAPSAEPFYDTWGL